MICLPGPAYYRITADLLLVVHTSFVVFVILGLALTLVGAVRGWRWIRNPWFRLGHLLAIGIVVAQAWLEVLCPLTSLEMMLRSRAGDAVYSGSLVSGWSDLNPHEVVDETFRENGRDVHVAVGW